MLEDYEWKPERQGWFHKETKQVAPPNVQTALRILQRQSLVDERSARLNQIQQLFEAIPTKAEQRAILSYLADIFGLWP